MLTSNNEKLIINRVSAVRRIKVCLRFAELIFRVFLR